MKLKVAFYLLLSVAFLTGCSNCEKLYLTKNEKDWVSHFELGQRFFYKSNNGNIDTSEISDTSNNYTPCNRFELSEYQYETYLVRSTFKSHNGYNGKTCLLTLTKNKKTAVEPEIIVGGLGTIENSLQRPLIISIDTVLNGVMLKSVYYYAKGLNAEKYGEKEYFKNFFWDKQSGLIAYTTINDEVFLRVKN